MRLHYLQHVPFEGLGAIEPWAIGHGAQISCTRFWAGGALPSVSDLDWLVIMGGPMNVDEEPLYPWLKAEKQFIEKAMKAEKKILGVCLGAQLIARVLGSRVYKNQHKEIGWMPVKWTEETKSSRIFKGLEGDLTVFHWHGDTFDLPSGAVRMAESEGCRNQAFAYGANTAALQFHLESTPESVAQLAEHCADELVPGKYIQGREEILACGEYYKGIYRALAAVLNGLTAPI